MGKALLTYTLDWLSFSRTVLQAVLKVFCGQSWCLYSCSCRRMQHWYGVDVPLVPVQCTHKLFIWVSYRNRENKNLSLEALQICFCFSPVPFATSESTLKSEKHFSLLMSNPGPKKWDATFFQEGVWPGRFPLFGPQCFFWQKTCAVCFMWVK